MTTYYTITGRSTTRPSNLPVGFEVTETNDKFVRSIPAGDESRWVLAVEEVSSDRLSFTPKDSFDYKVSSVYLTKASVRVLRDALTSWLDGEETYDDPDVQPDFSLTLVCPEGYILRHDTHSRGHWSRYDGDEWQGWDLWTNYVASYGPWKVQR